MSLGSCSMDARPNFVIIIADDLGWNDVGAYGNTSAYTPNIDALAQEGIRFTQAFLTTSSCSASRASILTGKYPHSNGLTDLHQALPASQNTLAGLLGKAGYHTVAAGKWHLGKEVKSQFDVVYHDRKGSGTQRWAKVLDSLSADRPFFLWLASIDPHRPHEEGKAFLPRYKKNALALPEGFVEGKGVRSELLAYYLEVSSFDADVGRVIKALETSGNLDNTVVIVMSDNGRPFARSKQMLYDDGIKTPFIVHWPSGMGEAGEYSQLISAVDIAPTILELARLQVPEDMQGISFAPVFRNRQHTVRDYVFAERNRHVEPAHERAVRSLQFLYKENQHPLQGDCRTSAYSREPHQKALLQAFKAGTLSAAQMSCFADARAPVELFAVSERGMDYTNLAEDPAFADIRQEMSQQLRIWRNTTGDFDFVATGPNRESGTDVPADAPEGKRGSEVPGG